MPEVIPPQIQGPCSACSDCLDNIEADLAEISAGLTAIRQFAQDIRKFPTDTKGVVDYSTGRIIQIIDHLNGEKEDYGKANKNRRS